MVMFQQLLSLFLVLVFSCVVCVIILSFFCILCYAHFHVFLFAWVKISAISAGLDVSDIEKHRSQKIVLENSIAELEESLRILHADRRQLEDETAKLHRERVCCLQIKNNQGAH